jgi:hypothetical protein
MPFKRLFASAFGFFTLLSFFSLIPLLSGCGVFTDMVRDNELKVPLLNSPGFNSPARLRAGVLPFDAQIDLGTGEAGSGIARLVSEEFAQNRNLLMVDPKILQDYANSRGIKSPITPEEAKEICRDLNLNLVFDGTIAHIGQHQVRTGWRRLFRWFTSQQIYIEAILSLVAYDPEDGSVLSSRAGESRIRIGRAPERGVYGENERYKPTQEEIEESLDEAIEFLYLRSLEGLKTIPFKAQVKTVSGDKATISFGTDVKLKRKTDFAKLTTAETITNAVGVSYSIPGPPEARLRVDSVSEGEAVLSILSGVVRPGDFIQSWRFDD